MKACLSYCLMSESIGYDYWNMFITSAMGVKFLAQWHNKMYLVRFWSVEHSITELLCSAQLAYCKSRNHEGLTFIFAKLNSCFVIIKPSWNVKITLSFTDVCKSCTSRENFRTWCDMHQKRLPLDTAFLYLKKASRSFWICWDATWHDDVTLT